MVGFLEVKELDKNYRQCQAYTREYARSFYFASHVLPRKKRRAAYAVYAFCRYADNVVDGSGDGGSYALRRLSSLRDQLRYVYAYSSCMDPKLMAFRDVVHAYHIPQEYFHDLLAGVEMDLTLRSYRTFDELHRYCYHVASVVGLIMTRILGVSDTSAYPRAADLGTAMQLTNILRDIGEDLRLDRRYLPADEMAQYGVTDADLAAGRITPQFCELMAFQIRRARGYYDSGESGIPMITNDGSRFCVKLMSATYKNILNAIEANGYDVFTTRAHVTTWKKLGLAAGSTISVIRDRYTKDQLMPIVAANASVRTLTDTGATA